MPALPDIPPARWLRPASVPDLSGHQAHVWRWLLAETAALPSSLLSPEEEARAAGYRHGQARVRFTTGRGALRWLLGAYLGRPPLSLRLRVAPGGRPELDDPEAGILDFNLSHSGDLLVVAVARSRVGVDVERLDGRRPAAGLAARFFSPVENGMLAALPAEERTAAFFRLWTGKEAWLKALGTGLAGGLDTFTVPLSARPPAPSDRDTAGRAFEHPASPILDRDGEEIPGWRLHHFVPAPGYAGALAASPSVREPLFLDGPVLTGI